MDIADPKLKQVRAEIEAVISRYNIGAVVILHDWPADGTDIGRSETCYALQPTYSLITDSPAGYGLRVRSLDYPSLAAAHAALLPTVNMLQMLAAALDGAATGIGGMARRVEHMAGFISTPIGFQPDPPKGRN